MNVDQINLETHHMIHQTIKKIQYQQAPPQQFTVDEKNVTKDLYRLYKLNTTPHPIQTGVNLSNES